MPEPQYALSRDDLIAYAKNAGEMITPHQLVRWHKKGLLSRPFVKHHGKGKGTTSFYPSSMLRQATFLSLFLRQARTLDGATCLLWLAGFPVTTAFRGAYLRTLDHDIATRRLTFSDFENDNRENAIDRAEWARFPKALAGVRRTHRPMLERLLTDLLLGTFTLDEYGAPYLIELAIQMRQRSAAPQIQHLANVAQREDIERAVAGMSNVHLRNTIARMSDAQLEADRARAAELWRLVMEASGLQLPLPQKVFWLVLLVRRQSPFLRALLRDAHRGLRMQGHTSFREALHEALKARESNAQR